MNLRSSTAALAAAASILLSADAIGAKLKVPGQFASIQAAVDAANPGDIVEIDEGTYFESIEIINKTDLTIRGDGKVILDGSDANVDLIYVETSDTVRIEDLVLRNADRAVHAFWSLKVIAEDLRVKDMDLTAFWFEACANGRVVDSKITDVGGNGVAISQSIACHVEETVILRAAVNGVYASGTQHSVTDCEIVDAGSYGVRLGEPGTPATAALVLDNEIENSGNDGILVGNLSTGCSILENTIKNAGDDGINVASASTAHLIDGNSVRGAATDGLELDGEDMVVSRNKVKKSGLVGIRIEDEADSGLYHANVVKKSALDGIVLFGSTNSLHKNKAKNNGGLDLNDQMAPGVNVYSGNSVGTTN